MPRRRAVPLLGALSTLAATAAGQPPLEVLVFTRTEGFHHESIADGVAMIEEIGREEGLAVDVTDDPGVFVPAVLARYDAVVWLSTTGDVLDPPEQEAFEGYIRAGGGWVGIHAAADCEYDWPWYGELLGNGAWFLSHPSIQEALVLLEDASHPASRSWPHAALVTEEWYNFQANPRPVVSVLLTVDEDTYDPGPGGMGDDHPIAWYHLFDGGRALYTALGHGSETYSDPRFRDQVRGAILWAAGRLVFEDGFERGDTSAWSAAVGAR